MGCLLLLHVMVKGQLVREVHSLLLASAPGLSSGLQLDSKCLYTLSHLTGPISRNLTEELDTSVSFLIPCDISPNFPVHYMLTSSSYLSLLHSSTSAFPLKFLLCGSMCPKCCK